MARTSNVFARVEPEDKERAEAVLNQLGIPMSNAIGIFLKQVILCQGLPFDVKLPERLPVAMGALTKEQFDAEIQKGFDDVAAGRTKTIDEVRLRMRREHGV